MEKQRNSIIFYRSFVNAVEELDAVADLRLTKIGGRGAVREAIEWLLKEQGKWESLMSKYFG